MLRIERSILAGLVIVQLALAGYLFALSPVELLLLTLGAGSAAALLCLRLYEGARRSRYREMCVVMFAAGGLGMLVGLAIDFGPYGVGGLLSLCQVSPQPGAVPGWRQLELHVALMPWTYAGMLLGGNLGLLLFDSLGLCRAAPLGHSLYQYLLCNAGMLVGMLGVETIAVSLLPSLDPLLGSAVVVIAMLAGMTLGMIAAGALVELPRQRAAIRR